MSDNSISLSGNLTRDPEIQYTGAGLPVAQFGLAVNRRWRDDQNNWSEAVDFIDIKAWNTLAENISQSLHKGDRVTVTGRMAQNRWTDQNGNNRSRHEVVATDVACSLRWATTDITKNPRNEQTSSERGPLPGEASSEPFPGGDSEPV